MTFGFLRMKKQGCSEYFSNTWNISDIVTIMFSLIVIGLYFVRQFAVMELTKKIGKTRGNQFIPIDR